MNKPSPKNSVTVRIAGEEHVLRSSADPEYTRACAAFLDGKVMEIREFAGVIENHRAVMLAALSITDRYFEARDELDRLRREVTSRSTNLVRRIEAELDEPGSASG